MIQMKINKKFNNNLVKYFNHSFNTDFIKYFYDINTTKLDIKTFNDYKKTILLRTQGLSASEIAKRHKLPQRKIEHWIFEDNKPFIIRLLQHFLILGKPKKGSKWLSINSTRGGLFIGPWIQVPDKINSYKDISKVINQLDALPEYKQSLRELNISQNCLKKENCLAYLLGILVGDASKTGIQRKHRVTRRIHIRLSKGFQTNRRMGDFITLNVNYLGLRMCKRKDCPAGKRNLHPFYTWISQSSLLFQWIFRVCLGLKNNETTTYYPIKAKWILKTPKKFKIQFLQGLADSDGFVDFNSVKVGIITEPNTHLIDKIFKSLNITTKRRFFTQNKLWSILINVNDAFKLPIFNPIVRSYRYAYTEKLYKAKRVLWHWSPRLRKKVEKNLKNGISGTKLVKKILYEDNIIIRTKGIRRVEQRLVT